MRQLGTFVILFCFILSIFGQVDTSLVIDEIEISTNRVNFNSKEWGRSIQVISKKEIEKLPVQSIAEALQMVAGLDVRRRGPNNVQSDISIRGGSFDQVLILINGVRMNDAQTGHHTLYLPVDLDDIERIEVVRGPAAKTYGQNAFSGAINIVTKISDEDKVRIGSSYGSFNTLGLNAGLSKTILDGKWSQNFAFSSELSDGFEYNRDYKILNYFYDSRIKLNENNQFVLFGGYTERKFGANGFYALPSFVDQYEEVQTSIGALKFVHTNKNLKITPGVSWRRNYDDYVFVRQNPGVFRNKTLGNRLTTDVHVSHYNKLGTTGIGIEFTQEWLRSWSLGERDRSIFGFYLEQKFQVIQDKLVISPGFYMNKFSDSKLQLLPGLDISYYPVRNFKIFASANIANRVPTYTDLFYSSSVEQGNPNLQSEKVNGYEVGIEYKSNGILLGLNTYVNYTNGLIDWTKTNTSDPKWITNNYAATIIKGLEFNGEVQLSNLLKFNNILNFSIAASLIEAESNEKDNQYITRYQFNHLGRQIISGMQVGLWKNNVIASVHYRNIDRVVESIDPETGDDLFDANLLDASLLWNVKNYQLKVTANNILSEKYKELGNVVMPGAWFDLKLNAKF